MAFPYVEVGMPHVQEQSSTSASYMWVAVAIAAGSMAILLYSNGPHQSSPTTTLKVKSLVKSPTAKSVGTVKRSMPSTNYYQEEAAAGMAMRTIGTASVAGGLVHSSNGMDAAAILPTPLHMGTAWIWAIVFAGVAAIFTLRYERNPQPEAMFAHTSTWAHSGGVVGSHSLDTRLCATEATESSTSDHMFSYSDVPNILSFGPNGSGKGTQGALIKGQYDGMAHIESGAIFREQIGGGTELGLKAKEYIDRGDLVPDEITIPMILSTLKAKGGNGWLLDGFPRSIVQAEKLWDALQADGLQLDYVVEILLDRSIAKDRIMGRRLCANDNNHPNNVGIDAIKPDGDVCRVCGGVLTARGDDQDEGAIDKRHNIYYDDNTGTLAAAQFYEQLGNQGKLKYLKLDGAGDIKSVKESLLKAIGSA